MQYLELQRASWETAGWVCQSKAQIRQRIAVLSMVLSENSQSMNMCDCDSNI